MLIKILPLDQWWETESILLQDNGLLLIKGKKLLREDSLSYRLSERLEVPVDWPMVDDFHEEWNWQSCSFKTVIKQYPAMWKNTWIDDSILISPSNIIGYPSKSLVFNKNGYWSLQTLCGQ